MYKKILKGIENNEFQVFLQAKNNIINSNIVGAEALIRWSYGDNLVTPNTFIPMAENLNIVTPIDIFVFKTLCNYINKRKKTNLFNVPISCNASLQSLLNDEYIDYIKIFMEQYNISPGEIEIEITETNEFNNFEQLYENMLKLKNLGINFALDDFGNSYSTFKCLALPVSTLKIAGDFFHNKLHPYENKKIFLKNMVNLASDLKVNLVVEGVETLEHIEILNSCGCIYAQGFYYSIPSNINTFYNDYNKKNVSNNNIN